MLLNKQFENLYSAMTLTDDLGAQDFYIASMLPGVRTTFLSQRLEHNLKRTACWFLTNPGSSSKQPHWKYNPGIHAFLTQALIQLPQIFVCDPEPLHEPYLALYNQEVFDNEL